MKIETWSAVASTVSAVAAIAAVLGFGDRMREWLDARRWWRDSFQLYVRRMDPGGIALLTLTFRGDGRRTINLRAIDAYAPGQARLHRPTTKQGDKGPTYGDGVSSLAFDRRHGTVGPSEWSFGMSMPHGTARSSGATIVRLHIEEISAKRTFRRITVHSSAIDWAAKAVESTA